MNLSWLSRRRAPARPGNLHFAQRAALRRRRLSFVLLLPVALCAFVIGAVSGLDVLPLLGIVTGAVFALLATFVLSSERFLQLMFVVTFVIQGSALYFGGLHAATWIATGMGGLFILRVLMDAVLQRRVRRTVVPRRAGTGVMLAAGLYFLLYGVSIALNRPGVGQLVSATKSNLVMFGVLASLYWFYWSPDKLERLWRIAIGIVLIQLPVTLYQHFFIASLRHNGFDSVVGTFGGTPLAGGLSSMLVLFVVAVMGYAMARWDRGLMSRRAMLGVLAVGLAVILLGEVKAAFLWLPICTFVVLRQRILKNVFSVLVYGTLAAMLLGTIYYAYDQLYWTDTINHYRTSAQQDRASNYFFDANNVDYSTGEVGRGASLALWWRDTQSTLPRRLIGYGPGASKSAGALGGGGVIARRFAPLAIDSTALAVLLWDEGVLGALVYAGFLGAGLWTGWRYLRRGEGSARQMALAATSTGVLAIYFTLLIYNRTELDEPTAQLMLMFVLGTIVQLARYRVADTAPAPAPAPARARMATPVYVGQGG